MRYGLAPLDFKPIAEQIIENGALNLSLFSLVDQVRRAVEIEHIEVIELSMDIEYIIPGSLTPTIIDRLVDLKDELGHAYTVHLPLLSTELSTFNEPVRRGSVESIVHSIKLAEPLSPETYVLHATGALASWLSNLTYSESLVSTVCHLISDFSAAGVEEIISQTEIDSRKIAIENFEFPFEITREIVDEFDTSICFDTGHLLAEYSGTESLIDFYRTHRDRIIEIHLHDGSYREFEGTPIRSDHQALGQGEMPIREFLMDLVKDDFKGPIIFELTADETKESLEKIESLVPEAL